MDVVTLTANPCIDRTLTIAQPLAVGGVHRVTDQLRQAGGKGLNVARTLAAAGRDVVAVLPLRSDDPLAALVDIPMQATPCTDLCRTNIALVDAAGVTTKINEAGARLNAAQVDNLMEAVCRNAVSARAVVLSGSLPAGVPDDFYVRLSVRLHDQAAGVPVLLDTADAPLLAVAAALHAGKMPRGALALLKPNVEELAQLAGADAAALQRAAERGDLAALVDPARALVTAGVGAVLATLGGQGALLVTPTQAWHTSGATVTVRSTVGAGDAALAGYVAALLDGAEPPLRLRSACAYGGAAAALPGTGIPTPMQAGAVAAGIALQRVEQVS